MITLHDADKEIFKNRKVIIICPGLNAKKEYNNIKKDIDNPIIIMINNHYRIQNYVIPNYILHNLNVGSYTKNDLKYWKDNNIKIFSREPLDSINVKHKKEYANELDLFNNISYLDISDDIYNKYRKIYNCSLLSGTFCVHYILEFNINELHIVGMDFYDSYYEYNNNDKIAANMRKNGHRPTKQFEIFKELMKHETRLFTYGNLNKKLGY